MKKIISLILTLTILVSVVSVSVSATWERKEGRYYIGDAYFDYEIAYDTDEAGGTLCVSRFSDNFSRKFTVPDEIDGVRYNEVHFHEINFIQTLVLGDGIEFIDFYYDDHDTPLETESNVEYLYVGKSFKAENFERMTDLYKNLFPKLRNVFVSEDNPYIATCSTSSVYHKVYTKDYSKLIYIPKYELTRKGFSTHKDWDDRVRIIERNVFTPTQSNVKKLEISKSLTVKLTEIYEGAFENSGLVEFYFGKNLKKVYGGVFQNSKKLKKVTFYQKGKTLEYIGTNVFNGCSKLSEVRMTRLTKVPTIYRGAFKDTKSGIKFYVKNRTVAKKLKAELQKKSKVKNAKILVGKKVIYKNING